MNRILSIFATVVAVVLLLLAGAVVHNRLFYYSQYNALLREIWKHPNLQIVDHWRHEDVTLEDFGFAIQSPRATAYLNISDGSSVRRPGDAAVGISLNLGDPSHQIGDTIYSVSRFIRFDSPEWSHRGLPKVSTVAEVVANFDAIASNLLSDPPVAKAWQLDRDFINLRPLGKRPLSGTPAVPMPAKWGF